MSPRDRYSQDSRAVGGSCPSLGVETPRILALLARSPQHVHDVPNIFWWSPTFSSCPQCAQVAPHILRLSSNISRCSNTFQVVQAFLRYSIIFRFYTVPWALSGPIRLQRTRRGPGGSSIPVGPYPLFESCPFNCRHHSGCEGVKLRRLQGTLPRQGALAL